MWYVLVGAVFLFGLGAVAFSRARRELSEGGVSKITFASMLIAFCGFGATVIAAAWSHAWPLPLPRTGAAVAGVILLAAGAAIWIGAHVGFTFQRRWGLKVDVLVTHGVYRFTRNPQLLSWFLMYCGIGLLGRSGAAITLTGLFVLACFPWILIEEKALERRFGEQYESYCSTTRRFM